MSEFEWSGLFVPCGIPLWLPDGCGMRYEFRRYGIDERVDINNAVYGFARPSDEILYIGQTQSIFDRMGDHERLSEAKRRGAVQLLVHRPGFGARVPYYEAEPRLIRHLQPPMNTQHRLSGLFALGSLAPWPLWRF